MFIFKKKNMKKTNGLYTLQLNLDPDQPAQPNGD